jgi:hypothetical protein
MLSRTRWRAVVGRLVGLDATGVTQPNASKEKESFRECQLVTKAATGKHQVVSRPVIEAKLFSRSEW